MNSYDVIVLGTGGVGSAAAMHLARRGARVLGLDRFPGGHAFGSSHGETRIIRKAYFEHPDYVPLLHRAYELWRDLEASRGAQLYHEVGLLEIGPPHGIVVPGVLESNRRHNLNVEEISREEFAKRFPGFVLPSEHEALFERQAGYLRVEQCVLAHLAEAVRRGAELRVGEEVVEWQADSRGISVRTDKDQYYAASLVITAGAWAVTLLADLSIPLHVRRKHLHWYACQAVAYRQDHGCPCFFYETPTGFFYGFPERDELGLKVANHSGGTVVTDPLADDKSIAPDDQRLVEDFLRGHLPGVSMQQRRHDVCYYTMSPDEHFLVDRHPQHDNVVFVAGLSGHGFKFTSVLGELMAQLALHEETSLPFEFLNCQRATLHASPL